MSTLLQVSEEFDVDFENGFDEEPYATPKLPFDELIREMDRIHSDINNALDNVLLQATIHQRSEPGETYDWFLIGYIDRGPEVLVLFAERGNSMSNPRFALKNRETGHIRLIKGISISNDPFEMQAIYNILLAMIVGGQELKLLEFPSTFHLRSRHYN